MARELTPEEQTYATKFAEALKSERKRRHLNQQQLGDLITRSRATVARYESGQHLPPQDFALALDEQLSTKGLFASLLPGASREQQDRLTKYVEIEQNDAEQIKQWQPQVVPALVQTPEYAREVIAASLPPKPAPEIERLVQGRLERQQLFSREKSIPAHFILDEGAARRLVGGPEVMAEQWSYLREQAEHPYITIQVLPHSQGAHAALIGAYTLLETRMQGPALYLETMVTGSVFTDIEHITAARQRMDSLMARSLSPAETIRFFDKLTAESR